MAGPDRQARTRSLEAALARVFVISRRHPRAVIGFWLLIALLGALSCWRFLGVDTDSSRMIAADAPFRQAALRFDEAFPQLDDQVVVVIEAGTQDAADAVAVRLTEGLRAREEVRSVYAPAISPFFLQNGFLYLSTTELEELIAELNQAAPLIERLGADPTLPVFWSALEEAASQAEPGTPAGDTADEVLAAVERTVAARLSGQSAPLSWLALFRDDLEPPFRALLTVEPVLDYSRLRPAGPVADAIAEEAARVLAQTALDADIAVTGDPVLRSEELESVSRGIGLAFAVSGVLVALLLYFAFRSIGLTLASVGGVVISISATAGLAALVFGELNLVSVAFAVLMVGLGVDFSVHLLLHARAEAADGRTTDAAFYRTARLIGAALALTAPTTALAFLAFSPTDFVGMRQLGMVAGAGVLISFAVAVTLLPAVFHLFPPKRNAPQGREGGKRTGFVLAAGGIGVTLLCIPAAFLLPQARFDADPMALRDASAPSVVTFDRLFDQAETAPLRLDVLAPSAEAATALAARLEALGSVRSARSLTSFVPENQDVKLDLIAFAGVGIGFALDAPAPAALPEDEALQSLLGALAEREGPAAARLAAALAAWGRSPPSASERALLERDLLRFWPPQRERLAAGLGAQPVSLGDLPEEIARRYVTASGLYRIEVAPAGDLRQDAARQEFVGEVMGVAADAAGGARSTLEAGRIVRNAMITATALALLLVSLLLWLVLRDFALLLLLLVPLFMAALLTTATGVVIGVPYNFANVIVLPLILGIGIDSGIHLALKSRSEGGGHGGVTARAVIYSALTTIASFGSLAFSPHDGTASMGLYLTIGIGWTLATTLLVLPLLADWLWRSRAASSRGAVRA